MDGWLKKLAQHIRSNIGNPEARTNFQDLENMIGIPDAANSNLDDILRAGYDSSGQAAAEDGSIIERLEQVQEAVNRGTGTSVPDNKSLYDILGTSYVDAGGAFQADSLADDLSIIATRLIDGTPGAEAGSALPAGKSLIDIIGTNYLDAGGAFQADSLADDLATLGQYLADGDAGAEVGTVMPSGKSIRDIVGTAYVDGGGAINTVSIADDLRTLATYLVDGTPGAEAGTALPAGKSLLDVIGAAYLDAGGGLGTDSVVSDLGLIHGLVDSAESVGPFSYLDAGGEQEVFENAVQTRRRVSFELDLDAMTLNGTLRLYRKVDGSTYRLWSESTFIAAGAEQAFDFQFTTNQDWRVTYQESADEGAARAIPFNVIIEVIE